MNDKNNKNVNVITFIYRRYKANENADSISYIYELDSIKEGYETLDDLDNVCFIDKDNYSYSYIDDVFSLDEDYAYAFTINANNLSNQDIKKKVSALKKESNTLKNYYLFQVYQKGTTDLKTYSVDPKDPDKIISIMTANNEGLRSLLSNEYDQVNEVKNMIKSKIHEMPVLLNTQNNLYADDIYEHVSKTVVCQDEQIKSIASSITKNQKISDSKLKDNLLICGPTGVGKTEIFRCISKMTGLPITMEDSTEYTASGFKGKDVTDILYNLYLNAGRDLDKAQRGIVLIDEIDKKISTRSEVEVYTKAVIDSLLKMAEGHVYHIENKEERFDIDTSFITFAMSGAFSGIEKLNENKKTMGFITHEEKEEQEKTVNNYTESTLLKYGVMPEFLGRNKLIVMNNLGEKEFNKIIQESDKSHLLLYKYMLENMGINFIYDEDTINAIAKKAVSLGAGARSIKKIIENAFEVINYQVFSKGDYTELIITPETIEDNTKFILR